MPHPVTILLVEDNADDEALTVMALRGVPATLEVARDGQEAMDYLTSDGKALPRLVLLDLKLPKIDGLEVLRRIREHDRTRLTPVVVLTSSNAPNDVECPRGRGHLIAWVCPTRLEGCGVQGRVRRIPWSFVVRRSSWCVRAARSPMSRSRSGSRIRRCVTGASRPRSIRVAVKA